MENEQSKEEEPKEDLINSFKQILDVVTLKDGFSAKDVRGNIYKIESITIGVGAFKKPIKYTKMFIKEGTELRGEVLPNGKLNII